MLKNVRVRFFLFPISAYSIQIWKNKDQKKSLFKHFSSSKNLKKKQFAMFFLFDQILHKNKPSKTAI